MGITLVSLSLSGKKLSKAFLKRVLRGVIIAVAASLSNLFDKQKSPVEIFIYNVLINMENSVSLIGAGNINRT